MHGTLPKLPAKPPATLRATMRERRRSASRRPVTHIALPGYEVARVEPRRRETITALLKRTGWARRDAQYGWQFRAGLPTILTVNGEPVLRKRWRHTRIGAGDVVQFVSRPLGGQGGQSGGKQVIGLVALIAVVAFASVITGGAAAGLIPGMFGAGSFSAAALAGVVGIGGSLLINTLIAPKAGATNDPNAKTDQIYTASASGNLPKLGQPLPVGYGREKVYPDFAATPWGEFVANDQYQNILLSVGFGRYDYEQLYIDDTPLWDPTEGVAAAFSSAQIEFYDPGEQVTLFPASVVASSEVTGQQLPHGTGVSGSGDGGGATPGGWIGGYVANGAGTIAQSLAIDFVFPAGCFVQVENETRALSVGLRVEYRTVNGAGAPTGPWLELFDVIRSYASRSPIRDSIKVDVAEGRYEVRFRRNDGIPDSNTGASDVIWAGLRAFLKGTNTFPVSTIAIRIKGTESTQGSFKFGALRTRILPVWDAESATFVEQPTRNNAWAFLDAIVNEEYGSGHPISKADFNAIVAHAAGCDARGDHFDYTFSSAGAVPETLDKILMPSRAKHFWLGDTVSIVRDEWRDVPSMLLTDREIVRDSTQIGWTMLGEEDPDAVIIEYVDEETWRPAQVQYPPEVAGPGGFHATNAETKRIDGIVNRDHAYREAAFLYLQSIYRRENVQIGTEYEGRAITFGSVLRVQSELPMAYGYGGAVVDRNGNSLTLSPAPSWADSGNHYIRLRRPNGKFFGPVLVTKGDTDNVAVLGSGSLASAVAAQGVTLSEVLVREDGGEDPSFELGTADNQSRLCVVLSGQPNGNQCTLNLVVDDERVHAIDIGTPPVLPTAQFPADLTAPLIAGLNASFTQGVAEPKLAASWFPAAGAFYYVAEVSYDNGANWIQVYEGRDNKFDTFVTLAALTLRVQAIGKLHGPYSQVSLGAPTIVVAPGTVATTSLDPAAQFEIAKKGVEDRIAELEDIVDQLGNELAAAFLQRKNIKGEVVNARTYAAGITFDLRTTLTDLIELNQGEASASIEEVRDIATATDAAFSAYTITTTASLGNLQSQITTDAANLVTTNTSIATLSGSVTAQFGTVNSAITTEQTARANADSAITSTATALAATVAGNTSAISSEASTRASADTSITSTATALASTVAGNTSAITSEASTRASADTAINGTLTSLSSTVSGNTSAISSEAVTRANADTAIAGQISSLTTTVSGNTSAISTESAARSSADASLAASISALSSSYGGGNNRLKNPRFSSGFDGWITTPNWVAAARADADGSWAFNVVAGQTSGYTAYMYSDFYEWGAGQPIGLSGKRYIDGGITAGAVSIQLECFDASNNFLGPRQQVSFVSGGAFAAGQAAYFQDFAGPTGETTPAGTAKVRILYYLNNVSIPSDVKGGLIRAMLSDDPRRPFADFATSDLAIAKNTTEAATRAAADSALSTSVSTLSTTVGGHTSSISQMVGSKDGVGVYYSLLAQIDGVTGGLVFTGAKVNGGATVFNWKMNGNVVLDGTLYGQALVSNSVNTNQLAINGVDFSNIIDGATSKSEGQQNDVTNPTTLTTLCNFTIATKGGRLQLVANVTCPRGDYSVRGELWVDGAKIREGIGIPLTGFAMPPVVLIYYYSGIADGTHTIQLKVQSYTSDAAAVVTGALLATNLRK